MFALVPQHSSESECR